MTEEAKKQLSDFLIALIENLKSAGSFAKNQIPDILVQKIHYEIAKSIMALIGCALLALAFYKWHKLIQLMLKNDHSTDAVLGYMFIVAGSVTVLCFTYFVSQDLIMAVFAPKLMLLEWAKGFLK